MPRDENVDAFLKDVVQLAKQHNVFCVVLSSLVIDEGSSAVVTVANNCGPSNAILMMSAGIAQVVHDAADTAQKFIQTFAQGRA